MVTTRRGRGAVTTNDSDHRGLRIDRHFTTEGLHPYDELSWETRDAVVTDYRTGEVAFEQRDVEFPRDWSMNATMIVAQKYFRGPLGTPQREHSVKQMIDRVADTITDWGRKDGYFAGDESSEVFNHELKHLLVRQKAAFNSPVWFNVGVEDRPQASACQPWDAPVSTPDGLISIGRLVDTDAVGTKVFDAHGLTRIVAVKANGRKEVLRLHLKAGSYLDVTPDHLVWKVTSQTGGRFVEAGTLKPGDHLQWHRTYSHGTGEITQEAIAEAALAGWLQSDGFVGQYQGTNRSLTIEAMTVTHAERAWVLDAIDKTLPGMHRHERLVTTQDASLDCRRNRIYGRELEPFIERWDLRKRGTDMELPQQLLSAPLPVVASYLRSMFQAEGYVSMRERSAKIGLDLISERLVRGIQSLLLRFGIFSRVGFKQDKRPDRHGCWSLSIANQGDRVTFHEEIGFIDPVKANKLEATLGMEGKPARATKKLQIDRIERLGSRAVYDIQTESGEYLSGNLRVHNCFILSVEDTMSSILNWYVEEGTIFKGGSGSGVNLSKIRSSKEQLRGGGQASGPVSFMRGADASAGTIKCLHRDTEVVTDRGVVGIADVAGGDRVLTRYGFRTVNAVHDNGTRDLVRVRTSLGDEILCTPEHRFWVRGADGETWREANDLRPDDHVMIDLGATEFGTSQALTPVGPGHHNEIAHDLPEVLDEAVALWLGWVYGDGSITWRESSKFVAVQVGDEDPELVTRYSALVRTIFGEHAHLFVNRHGDRADASGSVRFCSSQVIRFLEANGLRKGRARDLRVPELIKSSPAAARAAFLAGVFEADGHVGNGYPWLSSVSPEFARDVHRLLLSIGIPSTIGTIADRNGAFGTLPMSTVRVVGGVGVARFAKLVGFVSERKSRALEAAVERKGLSPHETQWMLPHVSDELDEIWARSGGELKRALAPYCRYTDLRSMSLLRARALVERFPRELGSTSLAEFVHGRAIYVPVTVEPVGQGPTFDLTVDGVHEYLVHNVVTHNSGGKTRRAAKMVILDADHPDVEEFIWCKQREELKARALGEAGFDMDLDGRDSASIQYQNANNSVRVTDEFMGAVQEGRDWELKAITTGETIKALPARDLMRQIAQAAWECADPGMQYDTTINDWHTTPNAGRINGSNPCCFTGDALVTTTRGPERFELLEKAYRAGEALPAVSAYDVKARRHVQRPITRVWVAGQTTQLREVMTTAGLRLRCTPEHRFLLHDGTYRSAESLRPGDQLVAVGTERDAVLAVEAVQLDEPVDVYDLEVAGTHNFAVSSEGAFVGTSVIVHNSEYMHLDNSACNLASLNLRKFEHDGVFDVEDFKHAVEIIFLAQEILVDNSSYPTEKIAANAKAYRQLGLGYTNLGGLLLSQGIPYDSDEGRAWAAAITSLMTGQAYRASAEFARVQGPFDGYANDRDGMLRVVGKHRAALDDVDAQLAPSSVLEAAREAWDGALENGTEHGIRNAQATVLAPTGTISFLMDCDTTGIEPDLGLVKMKKLVGGGTMKIVNRTVPVALKHLGYQPEQIEAIVDYIDEHSTIEGAPAFKDEHLPVFDCAMGERSIAPMGHVRMMAAVQTFISGALSKTVNLPESATVEDVEGMYMEGWRLGLKAIAIYRDNCKVAQPLAIGKRKAAAAPATDEEASRAGIVRRRLPKQRPSQTFSFQVGDAEGYMTAGEYPGDGLGEMFVKLGKQGSTLSGVMDAFAISVSLGLQYGVPLEAYVSKFINMRFEPAGMTDDPEVKFASSLVDYMFRRLAIEYLPAQARHELNIYTIEERTAQLEAEYPTPVQQDELEPRADAEGQTVLPVEPVRPVDDNYSNAPMCYQCGVTMVRAGTCHCCPQCGSTSGCS